MVYRLEIDDRDETARAVLDFIRQMAEKNKAIKTPVAVADFGKKTSTERPLGIMKGSFKLSADFNEPLDDLGFPGFTNALKRNTPGT